MKYAPRSEVNKQEDQSEWIDDVSNWAYVEFSQIEQAFNEMDSVPLTELHVEPAKPRTGLTVLADGTDWDPGSGQGVYTYYGAAWHKLG